MQSAGMNILTELGYFSLDDRAKLMSMEKLDRNILIGKLLRRDKQMVKDLEEGFKEARRIFMENNSIQDREILTIKKDAIFLIDRPSGINGDITELLKIRKKKSFNMYMNILGKEHYYNTSTGDFEVKGYTKEVIDSHSEFLFKDLRTVMDYDSVNDKDSIYRHLAILKDDMVNYNLPIGYYRSILNGNLFYKSIINDTVIEVLATEQSGTKNLSHTANLNFILEIIYNLL